MNGQCVLPHALLSLATRQVGDFDRKPLSSKDCTWTGMLSFTCLATTYACKRRAVIVQTGIQLLMRNPDLRLSASPCGHGYNVNAVAFFADMQISARLFITERHLRLAQCVRLAACTLKTTALDKHIMQHSTLTREVLGHVGASTQRIPCNTQRQCAQGLLTAQHTKCIIEPLFEVLICMQKVPNSCSFSET